MGTERTWAQINLSAAKHNYRAIVQKAGAPAIAVIKADAYGHGVLPLARLYEDLHAPLMAVACLDEAVELREAGITTPILILGITPMDEMPVLTQYRLTQTVPSVAYARQLHRVAPDVTVHVKLDTGMGRLGVRTADEVCEIARLVPCEGIYTHFANADSEDLSYTEEQLARFLAAIHGAAARGVFFRYHHCAASTAVLHVPAACDMELVRPGLLLYGLYPDARHEDLALRPVMSLFSRVCDVRMLRRGECVSYGCTFTAPEDMPVAVLPVGYADGLRRGLSNSYEVLLCGERVPIIGRICMDMCMVDARKIPNVQIGEVAELFGARVSVDEMAAQLGTISYEICTGISKRVPRVLLPTVE